MPQRHRHHLVMLAVALCALATEGAWAGRHGDDGRDNTAPAYNSGQYSSMPDPRGYPGGYSGYPAGPSDDGLPASVRRIQRETGGQILRAQPYERDGREVYRVKVLTPQGRIRVYEDDPSVRNAPPPVYPGTPQVRDRSPYQGPPAERAPTYPEQGSLPPSRQTPPAYPRRPQDSEPNHSQPAPARPPAPVYQSPPRQFQPPPGRRRGG